MSSSAIITVLEAPTTIVTAGRAAERHRGQRLLRHRHGHRRAREAHHSPTASSSSSTAAAPGNPGFPTCVARPSWSTTGTVPVSAGPAAPNGAPTATATFTPLPPPPQGRYVFVATYDPPGGPNPDVNYLSSTSACADPLEQVTVNPILPSIAVEKTANPTVVSRAGRPGHLHRAGHQHRSP